MGGPGSGRKAKKGSGGRPPLAPGLRRVHISARVQPDTHARIFIEQATTGESLAQILDRLAKFLPPPAESGNGKPAAASEETTTGNSHAERPS